MASLNSARAKARDVKRLEDMHTLQTAINMYQNDNSGNYPPVMASEWGDWGSSRWDLSDVNLFMPNLIPTYIPSKIIDPINNNAHDYSYYKFGSGGNLDDPTDSYYYNCPASTKAVLVFIPENGVKNNGNMVICGNNAQQCVCMN